MQIDRLRQLEGPSQPNVARSTPRWTRSHGREEIARRADGYGLIVQRGLSACACSHCHDPKVSSFSRSERAAIGSYYSMVSTGDVFFSGLS